jgi:hypothetical protein
MILILRLNRLEFIKTDFGVKRRNDIDKSPFLAFTLDFSGITPQLGDISGIVVFGRTIPYLDFDSQIEVSTLDKNVNRPRSA